MSGYGAFELPHADKVLSCGLYLHPHGIEARCGYHDEADLLTSVVEKTPDDAKAIANEWRQTAIGKGFTEVRSDDAETNAPS